MSPLGLSVLLTLLAACSAAAPSPARERYIRAHPHGWLELTVEDFSIPDVPVPASQGEPIYQRPQCSLTIEINSEPFLQEPLFPDGAAAPYEIHTGFRLPIPAGPQSVAITYSGCRVSESGEGSVSTRAELVVQPGMITRILLDGANLLVLPEIEDDTVTLESLADDLREFSAPGD